MKYIDKSVSETHIFADSTPFDRLDILAFSLGKCENKLRTGKLEANKRKELCKKERERKQRKEQRTEKGYKEAEFLEVIGTKVLRVFRLALHSHLY